MNNFMYGAIGVFSCVMPLSAMMEKLVPDKMPLHCAPSEKLAGSTCAYDYGLGNENQVDWESNETASLIKALQNQTMNVQDGKIYFPVNNQEQEYYSLSLKVARRKFNIMKMNVKMNGVTSDQKKTSDYMLRCIFLNKDVEEDFEKCDEKDKEKVRQLIKNMNSKKYSSLDMAECVWIMIGEKLRLNRKKLKAAFNQNDCLYLAKILKKPLCLDHIDVAYVKYILQEK